MMRRSAITLCQIVMVIFGLLPVARASQAGAPTLVEQLQAQYRPVKMGADAGGTAVLEPGTVLVVQKAGVLGVLPTSKVGCAQKYEDGNLRAPSVFCASVVKEYSSYFQTGSKVYPLKIVVNLKNDRIGFAVVACDSCNGTNPPTFSRAQVEFQFAKGALENPDVSKIEDAIGEVFAIDNGSSSAQSGQGQAQAQAPAPTRAAASTGPALSNDDVVKMVSAKLPDSVIVKKIKNSACAFDTSPDALVKLQKAGVSETVINAMVDKQ